MNSWTLLHRHRLALSATTIVVSLLVTLLLAGSAGAVNGYQNRLTDHAAGPSVNPFAESVDSSPVMFIENVGQFDERARFQVRGGTGTMWLAEDAIWITVVERPHVDLWGRFNPERANVQRVDVEREDERRRGVNLRLSFPGANPHPRLEPFDRLDTKVSYFIGNNPDKWRPDVPVWAGVRYVDLYPGVDLELTGGGERLTSRLVTHPDTGLEVVHLRVEGADALALDGHRLRLTAAAGDFTLPLPSTDLALRVEGITPDGQPITFHVPRAPSHEAADHRAVVPAVTQDNPDDLLYATFLGGSSYDDYGNAIAVDGAGSAYVAGYTQSADFPTTPGAFDTSHGGGTCDTEPYTHPCEDAFVVKLAPDGSSLTYATFLGGSNWDMPTALVVDGTGAAHLAGGTYSTDFPTTPTAFDTSFNGGSYYLGGDAFVAKLSPDGSSLRYATFLGGGGADWAHALAVDRAGIAYVAGRTRSADFPTTPTAFDTSFNGRYEDAFVVKLASDGESLDYATFLGGDSSDQGLGIAVDGSGAAYVTGETGSTDFPTTPGAFDTSYNGGDSHGYDAFMAKLNAMGSSLVYATFLGGDGWDEGGGIAVDGSGAAYVTGLTDSANFPTTSSAFDTSYNGGGFFSVDAFVAKLNAMGSSLIYATFLGGNNDDSSYAIAVDGAGSAYVAGHTLSADFPTTPDAFDTSYNDLDAFVTKLTADGESLVFSTFLGGSSHDTGWGIAVGNSGSAYVTGWTDSYDFPTTPSAFDPSYKVPGDAFLAKLAGAGYTSGPATDPDNSTISAQPTSLPANDMTAATITVQLLSAGGQPAWGKTVRLSSSRGVLDDIAQPTAVTDSEGRTTGTVRSSTPGTATISAFVLDDGVPLSNTVSVTFEPYTPPSGAFLSRLNQVVDTAIRSLDQIKDDAQAVAGDGTYFRGAIGADAAKLATGVVLNMADVIGGVNQTWQLQKAARLACPGCYVPGTWNVRFSYNHAAATRLLDIGFMRLEEAPASQIAEFIGWGGPKFYGKVLHAGARYVTKETAKDATQTIFAHMDDGMTSIAYPAVRDTTDDLIALLEVQHDDLLANLPAMTPADQSAYESDLTGRKRALLILGQQLDDERMTLANFRQVHEQQPNALLNFLLRFTAKGLATGFFDGPGAVAVGGTLLLFDGYMDGKQLSESMQMYDLATGALLGAPDTLRQTYHTAYRGLDRIARGLPANRATGQINSVSHHNQGSGWGPFWRETASWSEVSLTNTGNSETTFRVLAGYLADTTRFGLPWATMNLVEEVSITLAPHTSDTVRVDYKRADGTKGFSPATERCIPLAGCVPASKIYIDVLGTNEAGTYYIGGHDSTWQPTRLTLAGTNVLSTAEATTEDLPTIDPPLTTYVLSAPWTQKHEAQLWINNPFTSTVPVTVTQTLPPDITLLDPGGATPSGDTLTWNTVVSPTAMSVVTFTFGFPAAPGTDSALPAGTLSLISPLDGQPLMASSNVASFQALWPLTLDYATPGYVLPGTSPAVAITVTNWLSGSEITGTLAISVTDALSATVHAESQPFNVAAGATGTVSFTLPATLAPGDYLVHGQVSANDASAEAFADLLQVGLPGPLLDYRVLPLGPVYPNDVLTYTLRFTNTTGVPLSNAVLTASLSVSMTVVAGSITGGGVVEAGQVWWALGAVGTDQAVEQSFTVRANADAAPPGVEPGRLLSEPRLTADEIAPTWGPAAWNLVSLCGLLEGDVDCNCTVDAADLAILAGSWRATRADPAYVPLYDIVLDERINIVDIQRAAANWQASCP